MEFIIKTLRTMFYSLDKVIYGLIDNVYGLLIQISKTSIFSQTAIHSFSQRIYALVGIFMLFKVSVSLITYVLNPDEFADKEKGFTSVIKRIILSLVMLVLCPYVFNEAYELQAIILEENTIMTVVFATPSKRVQDNLPNSSYVDSAGQLIQFTIMYTFAQPNYDEFSHDNNYDLFDCRHTYVTDAKGQYESRTADNPYVYKLNSSCFGVYNESSDKYEAKDDDGQLAKLFKDNDYELAYQDYSQGVAQQSFSLFFKKSVILAKEKDEEERYFINYKYGISTAVGVGVLYLFLMFCIDIAVRSVKLGFLQMISPIPIISYVDPKSGKDGMFSKWFKMCTNTYLELFIRLFALYFGIYTITLVGEFRDVTTGEVVDNWLVKIFMIIGILIFIKKLPEILKKIVGEGLGDFKFTANPFKKLSEEALFGKQIGGGLERATKVATAVPLAGAASLLTGRGLHGTGAAMGKAFVGGLKNEKFGKNFSTSYGAAQARKKQINEMKEDGVAPYQVTADKIRTAITGQSRAQHIDSVSKGLKAIQDDYKSYESMAAGVDAVAKDFDKRRKAAESAGDYAEAKRWSAAFDERLKQIAQNKGRIIGKLDSSWDSATEIDADGKFINNLAHVEGHAASATEIKIDAGLANTQSHMDALAKQMNQSGSDVAGYQVITGSTATDIKNVKNQAQGSQQSIDTNAENRHYADVAKYSGGQKK